MTLQERIDSKLREIEESLTIYNAFIQDLRTSEEDRKVVTFKILYEMMAFMALSDFSEYRPSQGTQFMLATGLKGATGYVSIVEGKVVISPAYREVLAQRDEFLKNNKKN